MRKTLLGILVAVVWLPFVWCEGEPTPVKQVPEELVNSIGMKFRLVQPGSFTMGSAEGRSDEKPVHKVTLTKAFYIGVYEVTQEEWEKVMGSNLSWFKGPKNPVEQVSWEDAQKFIRKLSEKEQVTYRLPTEAEWEYACRAGTTTRFYWGDDPEQNQIGDYAWYRANSDNKTHLVGQKKPNAWGLYDMNGNVHEWCGDWYGVYQEGAKAVAPKGTDTGTSRAYRGGSWRHEAARCRSAYRNWLAPSVFYNYLGLRLVRTIE